MFDLSPAAMAQLGPGIDTLAAAVLKTAILEWGGKSAFLKGRGVPTGKQFFTENQEAVAFWCEIAGIDPPGFYKLLRQQIAEHWGEAEADHVEWARRRRQDAA